jgi:CubicO group peptidase (beta-lactamase class C family)
MQRSKMGSSRIASKSIASVAMVFAMLGLAACGGGGGGDDPAPPTAPANPPPATPPANTAPTVQASDDQTIKLPTNAVDVSGTAQDAESNPLTYAWAASPSAGVTIDSPSAAATHVTFTDAGTYTLTLTANDGTVSGSDTITVTVQPADATPPPPVQVFWPGVDVETDPNHGWTAAATPAEVNMDAALLAQAEAYALTGGGSGMVTRYGKLVHKWGNIDTRVDIKSATKSMGSIALGKAIDANLLALGDTAQLRYSGFGSTTTAVAPADLSMIPQITIQQLATHTAGFEKSSLASTRLVRSPGANWIYSDGGLNWLADTLTNVFQTDLSVKLTQEVWTKLNITADDLVWRAVPASTPRPAIGTIPLREFAAGIVANPNAMARVGLLFLRKGQWNGEPILSESFVQLVQTPQPQTATAALEDPAGFPSANEGYGVMWWTNATGQLTDVPRDAYWAWGLGDSLIVVVPSLDLVIARVGSNPDDATLPHWRPSWNGNYSVLQPFLAPIIQSVTGP